MHDLYSKGYFINDKGDKIFVEINENKIANWLKKKGFKFTNFND